MSFDWRRYCFKQEVSFCLTLSVFANGKEIPAAKKTHSCKVVPVFPIMILLWIAQMGSFASVTLWLKTPFALLLLGGVHGYSPTHLLAQTV
jgi:hypothetical protein